MLLISQGSIVAQSLQQYLQRHTGMESRISKNQTLEFYTTGDTQDFDNHATSFFGRQVTSIHTQL